MKKLTLLIVCVFGLALLLTGCGDSVKNARKDLVLKNNENRLNSIGLSCQMFTNLNDEKYPPDVNTLKNSEHVEDKSIFMWTNPETKKESPFIYCPGFTEASDVENITFASPEAFDGKRDVLFIDGHVERISESAFQAQAGKQSWKLPK